MQLAYADLIGGPRFAVSTGPISANALAVGIGSDFVWRDGLTIGIDYQLLHSFSDSSSHAFRVRISKELDGPGRGTRCARPPRRRVRLSTSGSTPAGCTTTTSPAPGALGDARRPASQS